MGKNSCHTVPIKYFSIQILVNFEIFETVVKSFPYALRALLLITENLSPWWLGKRFYDLCGKRNPSNFRLAVPFAAFEIDGWKFTGYLIFICYFISCWKKLSKKNCFHVSKKFTTCLTLSQKSPNKASRGNNWGAGICGVTVPSPTVLKLQLVSPLIFLRALRVLRFFPH